MMTLTSRINGIMYKGDETRDYRKGRQEMRRAERGRDRICEKILPLSLKYFLSSEMVGLIPRERIITVNWSKVRICPLRA